MLVDAPSMNLLNGAASRRVHGRAHAWPALMGRCRQSDRTPPPSSSRWKQAFALHDRAGRYIFGVGQELTIIWVLESDDASVRHASELMSQAPIRATTSVNFASERLRINWIARAFHSTFRR